MSISCPLKKAFEIKASHMKLFRHDCQHLTVICIVKTVCSVEEKLPPHLWPPATFHRVGVGAGETCW